jgi:hypothetical protein
VTGELVVVSIFNSSVCDGDIGIPRRRLAVEPRVLERRGVEIVVIV